MKIISTDKAPAAIGPYSQAIVTGNYVFTSGQIPIDPLSGEVKGDCIVCQTEQVMSNLKEVLQASGAGFETAIKTTCFLTNMADFAEFNRIYEKYKQLCRIFAIENNDIMHELKDIKAEVKSKK